MSGPDMQRLLAPAVVYAAKKISEGHILGAADFDRIAISTGLSKKESLIYIALAYVQLLYTAHEAQDVRAIATKTFAAMTAIRPDTSIKELKKLVDQAIHLQLVDQTGSVGSKMKRIWDRLSPYRVRLPATISHIASALPSTRPRSSSLASIELLVAMDAIRELSLASQLFANASVNTIQDQLQAIDLRARISMLHENIERMTGEPRPKALEPSSRSRSALGEDRPVIGPVPGIDYSLHLQKLAEDQLASLQAAQQLLAGSPGAAPHAVELQSLSTKLVHRSRQRLWITVAGAIAAAGLLGGSLLLFGFGWPALTVALVALGSLTALFIYLSRRRASITTKLTFLRQRTDQMLTALATLQQRAQAIAFHCTKPHLEPIEKVSAARELALIHARLRALWPEYVEALENDLQAEGQSPLPKGRGLGGDEQA